MRRSRAWTKRTSAAIASPRSVLCVLLAVAISVISAGSSPAGNLVQQQEVGTFLVPDGLGLPLKMAPGIDSRLVRLAEIEQQQGAGAARRFAEINAVALDGAGRPRVLIHLNALPDGRDELSANAVATDESTPQSDAAQEALFEAMARPVQARVNQLGGRVLGRMKNLVEAWVPANGLGDLAGRGEIAWVRPSLIPRLTDVVSEGVGVINADALQASPVSYKPSGEPVKVGVLDLGFRGYAALLGTELPAGVTVRSFHPGGIEADGLDVLDAVHGTACAEIVHDVAPDAELFLANFDSVADHDDAVDWMIAQGVDVISYSIGWTNAGPGDGRGVINDAVNRALDAGIEWVGSAGNDARDHWEGTYNDPDGNAFHNFTPNDESNAVFLDAGDQLIVFLSWDDWFASDQDYDLYILDSDGNVVAGSTNFQTGSQEPTEAVGIVALVPHTFHVVVNRFSATRNVKLEMFFRVSRSMQYIVPAGSLTIPADTDGSVAVGATFFGDDVIESFSSLGPTTDGRTKPDIAAPDGVSTRSYGDLGFFFFGTSASAPHTAGAVALMKSRFGIFSLEDIRRVLYGRSLDLGIAGMDNTFGHGRLDVRGR